MGSEGNRVYVKTATTGTGTITLGAVVGPQFCTFAEAGIADGTQVRSYILEEGADFEIGVGTYTASGTTLSRTTVRLSRIGGAVGTTKMTLAGNATVRVIAAAEDLVTQDTSGDVSVTGNIILPTAAKAVSFVGGLSAAPKIGGSYGSTVAANASLGFSAWNGTLVLFRDETVGGAALVFVEAGFITPTIITQSGTNFVTADPGAGASKWWLQNSAGHYCDPLNRYAASHFLSYVVLTTSGTTTLV